MDGRGVESVVSTELIINGTEFLPDGKGFYSVESSSPHTFDNLDIISVSGMSTTSSRIEGSYTIGVTSESFRVVGTGTTGVAIGATAVTGIVTFFEVRVGI